MSDKGKTSTLGARSCNGWSLMFGLMKEDIVLVQPHKVNKVNNNIRSIYHTRSVTFKLPNRTAISRLNHYSIPNILITFHNITNSVQKFRHHEYLIKRIKLRNHYFSYWSRFLRTIFSISCFVKCDKFYVWKKWLKWCESDAVQRTAVLSTSLACWIRRTVMITAK